LFNSDSLENILQEPRKRLPEHHERGWPVRGKNIGKIAPFHGLGGCSPIQLQDHSKFLLNFLLKGTTCRYCRRKGKDPQMCIFRVEGETRR